MDKFLKNNLKFEDTKIKKSKRNQEIIQDLLSLNGEIDSKFITSGGLLFSVSNIEYEIFSSILTTSINSLVSRNLNFYKKSKFELNLKIINIQKNDSCLVFNFKVNNLDYIYKILKENNSMFLNNFNEYLLDNKYFNFSCYNKDNNIQIILGKKDTSLDFMSIIVQYLNQKDDNYKFRTIIGYTETSVKSIDLIDDSSILICGSAGTGKSKEIESIILSTLILNKKIPIDIITCGVRKNDGDIYSKIIPSNFSKIRLYSEDDANKLLDDILTEIDYRKLFLEKNNLSSWEDCQNNYDEYLNNIPLKIFAFDEFSMTIYNQPKLFLKKLNTILKSSKNLGMLFIFSIQTCNGLSDEFLKNISVKLMSICGFGNKITFNKLFGFSYDLIYKDYEITDRIFYTNNNQFIKNLMFTNNLNYVIMLYNYLIEN